MSLIHVIPDDSTHQASYQTASSTLTDRGKSSRKRSSTADNIFQSFIHAGHITRNIGSNVIKCESALVNQRLVAVQEVQPQSPELQQRSKRRKHQHEEIVEAEVITTRKPPKERQIERKEENDAIERQVARVKRMSMLLRSLEATHQLFLEEMIACAQDYSGKKLAPPSSN